MTLLGRYHDRSLRVSPKKNPASRKYAMSLVQSPPLAPAKASQITARALMLGERLDTAMLERSDVISTAPLAFRADGGCAVLFRYGIAVLFGLSPIQEDELLRGLRPRVVGAFAQHEG